MFSFAVFSTDFIMFKNQEEKSNENDTERLRIELSWWSACLADLVLSRPQDRVPRTT